MTLPNILRKRLGLLAAPFLTLVASGLLISCENETPTVGSALASGEVHIAKDSLIWNGSEQKIYRGDTQKTVFCPKISYSTEFNDDVDSRSTTNLIGRISVKEYGDLNCSYVSRLMSVTSIDIPDSIGIEQIDSMKIVLSVPRGALTGDSLAPQQLKVYRLTKSLPDDITNRFDPTGYYDPENPLGSRSFTLSALGMNDSIYTTLQVIGIQIPMPRQMAIDVVKAYRNKETSSIFAWPQTFENYFHGIYVEPTFGRGCVANISFTGFYIYYNYKTQETTTTDGTTTTKVKTNVGVTGVFGSSPIVLSSNNITYKPSSLLDGMAAENKALITSPGGYRVNLRFPGQELVDIYNSTKSRLAVVSNLKFTIPVEEIDNDYDLTPPPYLLMVKTSKLKDFFENNSLPNYKDSFYAVYDSKNKQYDFDTMRNYILDLIQNGVKDEDLDFTIVPVNLGFETEESVSSSYNLWSSYWGVSSSNTSTSSYPTKCTPYILKPSMCRLKVDEAQTVFIYSLQQMQ
ncbi:MAG: DUF4270 domain-containing protein [Muribaculaceae bacterium]|nr:DUF4270 domain-containing protein [Muribaculaceae bacterium]